jgi:hypothetical protein
MAETKHILILANSIRPGGFCVAGKLATPLEGGNYDISNQWIRLVDPRHPDEGVQYGNTLCHGKAIRPLDMVKVVITEHCNKTEHPEDYFFDHSTSWEKVAEFDKSCLSQIADNPATLWNDGTSTCAVKAGFVHKMEPKPFSICLISGPSNMDFTYWKKTYRNDQGEEKNKWVRNLSFHHAGIYHEFSVTDPVFMAPIWGKMTGMPQLTRFPDPLFKPRLGISWRALQDRCDNL